MAPRPTNNVAEGSFAVRARSRTGEALDGAASPGKAAMFSNTNDLQIVNSTLSIVGRDVHNQVQNHYHYERKRDIWAILHSVPNFRDVYHDTLEKATPGTGMWLIQGDKFRVWLEPNGDIKIFWGSGIPGAGKTVLASIVIEYLEALRKELGGTTCVCYVYFRFNQREGVTVRNVLETLVKQTLERHPECRALIERTYAQHLKEGSEPTSAQLLCLLRELADRMTCTFYVLDALDEAPAKIQLAVVKTLASLHVKLFITSRPLETIQAKFPKACTTTVLAQDTDLDLHISKAIDESADLQDLLDQEDPLLKEEIISTIKQNCGGMFLHASLQLEALCECVSALEVRRTLKSFPSRIEDVYVRTWDRILMQNAEHVSLAKAVLVWVLNASRSMTIEELGRAVATSPDTHKFQIDRLVPSTTLLSLCRGLVTVEEESRLVRLVHYTAKDILDDLLHESFPHPHSFISAVCITHLAQCGFQNTTIHSREQFQAVLKKDPLLAYAAEAWTFHACVELHVEETKHRAARFIKESHAFPAFIVSGRWVFDILTPLHIVGLYKLPMTLIEGAIMGSPNSRTEMRQETPLTIASQNGHEDLVAHLIALPETQVNSVSIFGWSALMRAARAGQEVIVKLLLTCHGIQVNLVDKGGSSALMHASSAGHEEIVNLLLAYPGIEANLVDEGGRPAIMQATIEGQERVVELLLAYPGILVDLVDTEGLSALIWAARAGREGVVRRLLTFPEIQVNLVDAGGWSALMRAAYGGHEGVVKVLLAYPGIQVNLVDIVGWTALMWAASEGHEAVVKVLLMHSEIQVNMVNGRGWTALMLAASNGHEGLVKLLLAYPEIEVHRVSNHGSTALLLAAQSGYNVVVELLLTTGAFDVNVFDKDGDTAIKMAAQIGHEAIVRMLLDTPGVDISIRSTKDGHTAMSAAQANGHTCIVELLREFEPRKPVNGGPSDICQLSLNDNTEEVSDSGSEEAYHDAEEAINVDVGSVNG